MSHQSRHLKSPETYQWGLHNGGSSQHHQHAGPNYIHLAPIGRWHSYVWHFCNKHIIFLLHLQCDCYIRDASLIFCQQTSPFYWTHLSFLYLSLYLWLAPSPLRDPSFHPYPELPFYMSYPLEKFLPQLKYFSAMNFEPQLNFIQHQYFILLYQCIYCWTFPLIVLLFQNYGIAIVCYSSEQITTKSLSNHNFWKWLKLTVFQSKCIFCVYYSILFTKSQTREPL